MNIMYCGDHNISNGLFMSALSLKNSVKEPLHLYILTLDLEYGGRHYQPVDPDFMHYLENILRQTNPQSSIEIFDVSALFFREPPTANMSTRFTPCCMLRLYADEVKAIPERILYLDTDVLCRRNPAAFYYMDLEDHPFAGVLDNYGKWWFHNHPLEMDYMNSGVLLLNMKEIRSCGLFENCRHMCAVKKMFMPDQSALHKLAKDPLQVNRKYNEQKELHEDTVFQHFTTQLKFFPVFHPQSVKPWQLDDVHEVLHEHAWDKLFEEYTTRLQEYACFKDQAEDRRAEPGLSVQVLL